MTTAIPDSYNLQLPDVGLQPSPDIMNFVSRKGLYTGIDYVIRPYKTNATIFVEYKKKPRDNQTPNLGSEQTFEFELAQFPDDVLLHSTYLILTLKNNNVGSVSLYSACNFIKECRWYRDSTILNAVTMQGLPLYIENCLKVNPFSKTQYQTELGFNTNYVGNTTIAAGASRTFYIELITPLSYQLLPPKTINKSAQDFAIRVIFNSQITSTGLASLNDLIQITNVELEYKMVKTIGKEIDNFYRYTFTHHRFLNRNINVRKNVLFNANETVVLTWQNLKGYCPFFFVCVRNNATANNIETFVKVRNLGYFDSNGNNYLTSGNNTFSDDELDRKFTREWGHEFASLSNICFWSFATDPISVLQSNGGVVAGSKYLNSNDELRLTFDSTFTGEVIFIYYTYSLLQTQHQNIKEPLKEIGLDSWKGNTISQAK